MLQANVWIKDFICTFMKPEKMIKVKSRTFPLKKTKPRIIVVIHFEFS